jgi:hypothetical protein
MIAPPRPGDSIAFVDAKLARPFDPCRFIQNVFGVTARLGQSGSRVGGKYTRPSLLRMKRDRMTRGGPNTNEGPHPWVCVLANPLFALLQQECCMFRICGSVMYIGFGRKWMATIFSGDPT